MANHRVRGVSRCQWLCVAVGTPRKTMGLNRLSSLGESSQQPVDWAAQPSEQGWGGLDWGHWRIRTGGGPQGNHEGNSSEDAIGPRAGGACLRARLACGWFYVNQCGLGDRTTGPTGHRSSSDTGDLSVQCHSPFRLVGWLAAPYPHLCPALSDPVAPRDRRPNGVPV